MSDYVYTPDSHGDCLLCGCSGRAHGQGGWCPDTYVYLTEPDPDHLRD